VGLRARSDPLDLSTAISMAGTTIRKMRQQLSWAIGSTRSIVTGRFGCLIHTGPEARDHPMAAISQPSQRSPRRSLFT
jgi:cation transport ATPase